MRRTITAVGGVLLLFGWSLMGMGTAGAQEPPLCGPPGEEVPATIVGAGTIFGTEGDDVIVGSAGNDVVFAGGGNDIVCGEGGNDILDGGTGNDVLIGDELGKRALRTVERREQRHAAGRSWKRHAGWPRRR